MKLPAIYFFIFFTINVIIVYNVDSKIYKIYKGDIMKKKNNSYYFPIFTIVGTAFGFALKNIPTGLCLGVVVGIALDYQKKDAG